MKGRHTWWLAWLSVVLVWQLVSSVPVTAASNSLVAYPPTTPTVSEYPVSGARFHGIVTGSDGNLWLTDEGNQSIDQLLVSTGQLVAYQIVNSFGALPTDITLGPDGNVWFLDANGPYIGKVTPAGEITEFPITANSLPITMLGNGITAGPDGNIWFGDYMTPSGIDMMTPSGAVTRYLIPKNTAYNPDPTGITVGPDRNLWFTDRSENEIWKVTTSGAFTSFALPTPSREPLGITAGRDGNLWFGEQNHGRIGSMSTSGVLLEFPINTTIGVSGIEAGPDGNLWFGEAGPTQDFVAVMTTSGRYREFATPTPQARPGRPAAGPDGYMWFPEYVGNIAEAVPSGPWPPTSPWFANPSRPKSQALTTHSLSVPPRTIGTRARAATVKAKVSPSTTAPNRPNPAPILSAAARRILSSVEAVFP